MFNPLNLLSSAGTAITGFFGGIQAYLITGALALAVGSAGGAWVGYRIESGKVAAIQTADAEAETQAVKKQAVSDAAQGAVNVKAAMTWQAQYDHDNLQPQILKVEIPRYVTVQADTITCIPVSLARLMRAAADHNSDPASVQLATGQSDDACSDVSSTEMAGWFQEFAAKAFSNADQLTALQDWIKSNHQAQETP